MSKKEVKCEMAKECWFGDTGNCKHGKPHLHNSDCGEVKCHVFQVFNGILKIACKPVIRL